MLSDADIRQREYDRLNAEKEKPVKYAIYVVLVEDTNRAFEELAATEPHSIDSIAMELGEAEAMERYNEILALGK